MFVRSHALADEVLTTHDVFSSDEIRYSASEVPHRDNPVLHSMSAMDPPRHHELRRMVSRAFTPRTVDALTPAIEACADRLIDRLTPASDFVTGFAYPLPISTLAALLGVSDARQADFVRWTETITSFFGQPEARPAFLTAVAELREYLHTVPASEGIVAGLRESGLTADEIVSLAGLLLINGHETTKTLLVNMVLCLAENPAALAAVRADPDLVSSTIEEVLRVRPSVGGTDRFTTRADALGGESFAAGQRVIVSIAAANRDPAVFVDPNTFDVRRSPNPHLSFGHGIHFCLGAHLARRQAVVALRALLARLPGAWAIEDVVTRDSPVGTDVLALRLVWSAARDSRVHT
ncbi:cytochrome P450 [Kutzneria kofuensis]|uniref:Cytochrome P450 n=1 Tax=Kutzneria kofuensis TaxID=103725 RepID=A0A7W9NEX0_9PSEU|nr:cytochrome P450 [Kutzneria kofuensis]MBB5890060.1 cytochrome P450 [Kutzneria kofuensis]